MGFEYILVLCGPNFECTLLCGQKFALHWLLVKDFLGFNWHVLNVYMYFCLFLRIVLSFVQTISHCPLCSMNGRQCMVGLTFIDLWNTSPQRAYLTSPTMSTQPFPLPYHFHTSIVVLVFSVHSIEFFRRSFSTNFSRPFSTDFSSKRRGFPASECSVFSGSFCRFSASHQGGFLGLFLRLFFGRFSATQGGGFSGLFLRLFLQTFNYPRSSFPSLVS